MLQCYNFIFQESEPKQALYEHITIAYKVNFLKFGENSPQIYKIPINVAKSS